LGAPFKPAQGRRKTIRQLFNPKRFSNPQLQRRRIEMAITVVNGTNAEGIEFTINGMTDGSGTPMWSGSLTPAGQQGSQIVQDVSGFETYQVA
jgi:ribosomal protein S6E (S10)